MASYEDPSTIIAPQTSAGRAAEGTDTLTPALTIEWHPDPRRVGETAPLESGVTHVSRKTPPFAMATDVLLSRQAFLSVDGRSGSVEVSPGGTSTKVEVEGTPLTSPRRRTADQLAAGVIITLADAVVVCLHQLRTPVLRGPTFGMIGASDQIEAVRRAIDNVADLDVPVLIRGETGTGKELVARAVAAGSRPAQGPSDGHTRERFVAVNMATIPSNTAADELFGHEKGAFTGASEARPGYFVEADGGTLFLDEIANTPLEVQTMLLRVLEDGEVRPLGSRRPHRVNVRLVAATDANLEAAVGEGKFIEPLLHRLSRYQIRLPPLRKRRSDIGPLFLHFLRKAFGPIGEGDCLRPRGATERPWLSARDFTRIARSSFPGNIRTIVNLAHQLTISSRGQPFAVLDGAVEGLLGASKPESTAAPSGLGRSGPLTDGHVGEALRSHNYNVAATASSLGIHRSTLYDWMKKNPGVMRSAEDLSDEEILEAQERHGGDIAAMAADLRVSPKPLKARVTEVMRRGR